MIHYRIPTRGVLGALCGLLLSCGSPNAGFSSRSAGEELFEAQVKPVLEHRCIACHGKRVANAGLNFQEQTTILAKSKSGRPFVVPGNPEASQLFLAITRPNLHPRIMPGDGFGLNELEVAAIRKWIKDGAPWPKDDRRTLRAKPLRVDRTDYL